MPEGRRDGYDQPEPRGAPDAGLAAIAAKFEGAMSLGGAAAPGGVPGPAAPAGPGPEDVWPLRVSPAQSTAAGTLDLGQEWGTPTGRAWRLYAVTLTLGSGTTQVSVYKNAAQPVRLRFQTSQSGIWEPSMLLLLPGERLLVTSVGGGVLVTVDDADQIALAFLPRYLL